MTILGYDIDGQPLRAGDSAMIVTNMEVYGQIPKDEGMICTVTRVEPDKGIWHPLDCPCIEILEPTGICRLHRSAITSQTPTQTSRQRNHHMGIHRTANRLGAGRGEGMTMHTAESAGSGQVGHCVKCGALPTEEGHDGCLGALPWPVMNACCGHGKDRLAYVQFWEEGDNGRQIVRGFAARAIQKAMKGEGK